MAKPVSFDPKTGTVAFVPVYFKQRRSNRFVSWRLGIRKGVRIQRGTPLADIYWDDDPDNPTSLLSPVSGVVSKTNRRILHDLLHRPPAQWALILE